MEKNLLALMLASCSIVLTACNDSNNDNSSSSTSNADVNNIQNPVVTTTAYTLDSDIVAVAADSQLMTYKMKGVNGSEVQATALVFTPKTAAPANGWPVVVWAHGTTGVADKCAPSQQGLQGTEYLLMSLLNAGYVVVAPDYEGLGDPGNEAHPFLNVKSEAYSITDAVVAARAYLTSQGKNVSKQWMTVGHSQGGQAALGAAQYNARANLDYKGTVAIAPASNLAIILSVGESSVANADLNTKITTLASLDTFTALITAGLQTSNSTLKFSDIFKSPTDQIAELANSVCSSELGQDLGGAMVQYATNNSGSLEGYPRTQSNFMALPAVSKFLVTDSQPLQVKVNQPVIIYQGGADTTVPKTATDLLLSGDPAKQSNISYRTNDAWTHTTAYTANLANIVTDVQLLMPVK